MRFAHLSELAMNETERLEVFVAQTANVRELENAWAHVNRQINSLILAKNSIGADHHIKILALIYCALSEAIFSKLIHTPHGLNLDHVEQVKTATRVEGVKAGWVKCTQLALQGVEGQRSNHGPNVSKKLLELIEKFIFDPSVVRNKLAHGQWAIALNRENTKVNIEISKEIETHTVIELYRRKHALGKLSGILEDMIESPSKAHPRDYWSHLVEFESAQDRMRTWTVEHKVAMLFDKKARQPK